MGSFKNSKIYKTIEPVFKENEDIDYVVGHSAGGSATLELEKNYPNRKITTVAVFVVLLCCGGFVLCFCGGDLTQCR